MQLTEDQQKELARILASDTFKTAKEIVLLMTDGSVEGLPLDEAAIKMSNEKGVRNAFRLLLQISKPIPPRAEMPAPQRIKRTTR